MALAYGACENANDGFPRRLTFVIDAQGILIEAIVTEHPGRQGHELADRLTAD